MSVPVSLFYSILLVRLDRLDFLGKEKENNVMTDLNELPFCVQFVFLSKMLRYTGQELLEKTLLFNVLFQLKIVMV